jgi:outer membrane protein assembly factor BamD (BamD/ComL family)
VSGATGLALVLLVLLGSGCESGPSPVASEWSGSWKPVRGGAKNASAEKLRAECRKAFDAGSYEDAILGLKALRERFPSTAAAKDVETSFLLAESHYRLGEKRYAEAYPYYLEVLKGTPPEDMLKTTLNRVYDIGIAFLYGRSKKSFLGILQYSSPSFGVEILTGENGLVTNYPFLTISEDALMEVAKHYFDGKEYEEAEHVYERMSRDYPQSPWNQTAEYQLALAVYRQIRGIDYDQQALRRAREKLNLYLNHHPRGSQVEEARRLLHQIAEWEGMHDLRIAKYYLGESQPQAAMLYLRSVFIDNPKTDAAREAREIYENLEKLRGGT